MDPSGVAAEKLRRERHFHNDWARSVRLEELLVREAFEAPTAVENRYAIGQMGDLRGKTVLDLGCGAGETSVYLALQGAEVHAVDIAEEFLKVARSLAERFGVRLSLTRAEAHALPFAADTFD